MRASFRVFRNTDAWFHLGPFGGWWWEPLDGDQIDLREYFTKCGAARAARRALRLGTKERSE